MIFHPKDTEFYKTQLNSFEYPRNKHYPMTEAWALGSAELQNAQIETNTHSWHGYIKNGWFTLKREDLDEEHQILELDGITQLDFTFDQAMRPVVVWVKDDKSFIYRYVDNSYSTTELSDKFKSPRVELDDKLKENASTSDVILVYTYEGKLCYARQRDKFLQEFVIGNDPTKSLVWRVGTTKDGRFGIQWR